MAEEKLQEAARELTEAHHYQTELIQNEAERRKNRHDAFNGACARSFNECHDRERLGR